MNSRSKSRAAALFVALAAAAMLRMLALKAGGFAGGDKTPAVEKGLAGIQWVTIPGGAFVMGSPNGDDVNGNELPLHGVRLKTFQLAKTLVTNKQYAVCVKAGVCTPAKDCGAGFKGDDQPVVCVTWNQAWAFSRWAGGRLPSESEWEYAARSLGKDQEFPWGDEKATCKRAVIRGCGRTTAPVCSKPLGNTDQGLCDMAGNAWEWMEDWYHDSYDGAPMYGGAWENPAGTFRVLRGGAFSRGFSRTLRTDNRFFARPGSQANSFGFRPARTIPAPAS